MLNYIKNLKKIKNSKDFRHEYEDYFESYKKSD